VSGLYARVSMIGGLGLLLIGLGGGFDVTPLSAAGGIFLGFALGIGYSADTVKRALREHRCTCGDGSAEHDRSAVLRCPVHGPPA
jgi:hypothetical protein